MRLMSESVETELQFGIVKNLLRSYGLEVSVGTGLAEYEKLERATPTLVVYDMRDENRRWVFYRTALKWRAEERIGKKTRLLAMNYEQPPKDSAKGVAFSIMRFLTKRIAEQIEFKTPEETREGLYKDE